MIPSLNAFRKKVSLLRCFVRFRTNARSFVQVVVAELCGDHKPPKGLQIEPRPSEDF